MAERKLKLKPFLQPAFLLCVITLAATGGGISLAMKALGVKLIKEPMPIKKPFDQLDSHDLSPYRVLDKTKITNDDVLESLGTEDYIQWILEDTEAPKSSPVRRVLLFLTYYEKPDQVPHVPEECWSGGGFQRLATDSVAFDVQSEGFSATVPGKYLLFGSLRSDIWLRRGNVPVLYFFKVNGQYAGSRDDARVVLAKNLFGDASYFSKVEFVFNSSTMQASKADAVAATEKLLSVILPLLEKEHWPEWEDTGPKLSWGSDEADEVSKK